MALHWQQQPLFRLIPMNEAAQQALGRHNMDSLATTSPDEGIGIDIGFGTNRESSSTLATIGPDATNDIVLQAPGCSRLQCRFEFVDFGTCWLRNESDRETVRVARYDDSDDIRPFVSNGGSVELGPRLNTVLILGYGEGLRFRIRWSDPGNVEKAKDFSRKGHTKSITPPPAQTSPGSFVDEEGVSLWEIIDSLGEGTFADVHKARHIHTGEEVAVKVLKKMDLPKIYLRRRRREVQLVAEVKHVRLSC